jgi:hypothetical protein
VKLLNKIAMFACASLAFAACSGGPGTPNTGPKTVNTNVPGYLPFGSGDNWTFSNGATITDAGSSTLSGCSCALDGVTTVERMDLAASGGGYTGSLIYTKGTWELAPYTGHALTYLVGISEDHGNTVMPFFFSTDLTIPGVPAIDDAPVAGESFTLPPVAETGTGTGSLSITTVGTNQSLGAGRIINVATTTLVADGQTTNFSYAPGVGFTIVALAGGPMTLSAFSLSGALAGSVVRNGAHPNLQSTRVSTTPASGRTLSAMLEAWGGAH